MVISVWLLSVACRRAWRWSAAGFALTFFLHGENRLGRGLKAGLRDRLATEVGQAIAAILDFLQCALDIRDATVVHIMQRLVDFPLRRVLRRILFFRSLIAVQQLECPLPRQVAFLATQQLLAQCHQALALLTYEFPAKAGALFRRHGILLAAAPVARG
ncbi:hypothetical protein [Rhodanobacter umsongensis]